MASRIGTLLAVIALSLSAASCQEKTSSTSGAVINRNVNVADFAQIIDTATTGLLLDVRTAREFASGHIQGAKQIDFYGADFKERIGELDREVPVYIYCRSGNRSGQAASMMKQMGFKEVYNLQGGVGAWARRNQPLAR